jgi:hypothetical protein
VEVLLKAIQLLNNRNEMGWRTDIKIVHAIAFIKEKIKFQTREMAFRPGLV